MKILFLHGKESGPHGRKYQAIVDAGHQVVSPDLVGVELEGRVRIAQSILDREVFDVVVGSSLGGATAVKAIQRRQVGALVLCAPAVGYLDGTYTFPSNTLVIQGIQDTVVTHQSVLAFCLAWNLRLVSVNDDHRLGNSREHILAFIREQDERGGGESGKAG